MSCVRPTLNGSYIIGWLISGPFALFLHQRRVRGAGEIGSTYIEIEQQV